MTFGNYPKSANVGIRAGVPVTGAYYSMTEYLSCKVIFDYFWVKESAFQVLVYTLQWPPKVVVTNTKARSNACKEISSQGLSLSLLCFQFYLLFLSEFPIIFTHYSYFIPMPLPIIPLNFYCVSNNKVHSLFSS